MFCKKCGAEINDSARFCPNCGYDRLGNNTAVKKNIIEDNNILFQLKPTFNLLYKMLTEIGKAIFYLFVICYVFTGLYKLWFIYPVTILFTLGIILLIIAIKLYFEYMQYKDLEYNFYATKIEYKDGYLNKEEKELKYKHIREVTMTQNVLERICNIGTIRIYTNASSGYVGRGSHNSMRGKNGIFIHCVENVADNYNNIKEIIDEGTVDE